MFFQKHIKGSFKIIHTFYGKKTYPLSQKKCHHSHQHRNELSYSLLQLWLEYYLKEYSESRNNFRNFPADRLLTQALVGFSCRSLFIESFVFKSVCGGAFLMNGVGHQFRNLRSVVRLTIFVFRACIEQKFTLFAIQGFWSTICSCWVFVNKEAHRSEMKMDM